MLVPLHAAVGCTVGRRRCCTAARGADFSPVPSRPQSWLLCWSPQLFLGLLAQLIATCRWACSCALRAAVQCSPELAPCFSSNLFQPRISRHALPGGWLRSRRYSWMCTLLHSTAGGWQAEFELARCFAQPTCHLVKQFEHFPFCFFKAFFPRLAHRFFLSALDMDFLAERLFLAVEN